MCSSDLFWEQYLAIEADRYNPLAAPLRAADLGGVAPAVVATAGNDPLCSEGIAYVERLEAAGVPVDHHHAQSLCHGFCSLTERVPAAAAAFESIADDLEGRLS